MKAFRPRCGWKQLKGRPVDYTSAMDEMRAMAETTNFEVVHHAPAGHGSIGR